MSVLQVAERFSMTRYRVYQLSRSSRTRPAVFKRVYSSYSRFEITMESVSAYEAHLESINAQHARLYRPIAPLDFRRGVSA